MFIPPSFYAYWGNITSKFTEGSPVHRRANVEQGNVYLILLGVLIVPKYGILLFNWSVYQNTLISATEL